ncbi:MAG TPA: M28 family peptidase [Gemmatimonadales bacterium]|nr:M28 family peptidase [Gemmatimonadales bacterium]
MTEYGALLTELAVPRLAGTAGAEQVRGVLKRELAARGFVPMEHRFTARSLLHRWGRAPLSGVNVIAVLPDTRVATWLVAHYDAKGQLLSMASRLIAAALTLLGLAYLLGLALRAVHGGPPFGIADVLLGAAGGAGAGMLVANRVTPRSPGAVDNASGVVAVFAIVDALPPEAGVGVGVIFPDAEEYGLLGARALARERPHLLADTAVLNFDGIDDRGPTIAVMHRGGPLARRVANAVGARRARWLPVLVDGLALAAGARECVTIVRGNWATARIVHTPRDTPQRLRLDGARAVARGVATALQST